jgi:hypothetical protein
MALSSISKTDRGLSISNLRFRPYFDNKQRKVGEEQGFPELVFEFRRRFFYGGSQDVFDATGPGDLFDIKSRGILTHGVFIDTGIRLKSGSGGGFVVEDNHQDFALVVDGVANGRERTVKKGRITEYGDSPLFNSRFAQAIGDCHCRSDGVLGIQSIRHCHQAARISNENRLLPQTRGRFI